MHRLGILVASSIGMMTLAHILEDQGADEIDTLVFLLGDDTDLSYDNGIRVIDMAPMYHEDEPQKTAFAVLRDTRPDFRQIEYRSGGKRSSLLRTTPSSLKRRQR